MVLNHIDCLEMGVMVILRLTLASEVALYGFGGHFTTIAIQQCSIYIENRYISWLYFIFQIRYAML